MYSVQYASITQATDFLICLWCNMMDFSNMIDCMQHYCLYLSIYKENFIYRCMNCTVQRYYLVLYEKSWPNFYTLTKMSMKRCSIYNTHIKGKSFLQVNKEQSALRKIITIFTQSLHLSMLWCYGKWLLFTVLKNNMVHAQNKLKGKICSTYFF